LDLEDREGEGRRRDREQRRWSEIRGETPHPSERTNGRYGKTEEKIKDGGTYSEQPASQLPKMLFRGFELLL
jgi:hypothetical protein